MVILSDFECRMVVGATWPGLSTADRSDLLTVIATENSLNKRKYSVSSSSLDEVAPSLFNAFDIVVSKENVYKNKNDCNFFEFIAVFSSLCCCCRRNTYKLIKCVTTCKNVKISCRGLFSILGFASVAINIRTAKCVT